MPHRKLSPRQKRRVDLQTGGTSGMEDAVRIAQAFAEISREAAAASNRLRLGVAQRNIELGTGMLELAETTERREIAQALARHVGILRVNAAYRGTAGGGGVLALERGATAQAAQSAAVVSANTAFRVQQLINDNIVELEDENLAALEGGLRGFSIGQQIVGSLDSLARESVGPYGTVFTTPEFNLGALFQGGGDFEELFGIGG